MTDLYTTTGEKLRLDGVVGRGGEGEVYAIGGAPDRLVKRYTVNDLASREAKITRMVAAELFKTSNLIAFPIAPVRDGRGRFAGFIMARVNDHQPLHELYSPGARKAAFPAANYKFLVHAAANIARAVGAAHGSGCVIGDINHSGVLISKKATAALIDADSFQITDGNLVHFCKVGVPEYTAPELQQIRLDGIKRTQTHDEFGLAVAVFQLLWMGRHPFSGRFSGGEMPIERAIREFRFAYSEERRVGMAPPPGVAKLNEFPAAIGRAFELAFGPQGVKGRPSAAQWASLLTELEAGLRTCSSNTLHHYPAEAQVCLWCRMEKALGAQLFLPPFTPGASHTPIVVDLVGKDLASIWRTIESVPVPPVHAGGPVLPTIAWTQSPTIVTAQRKERRGRIGGGAILIAALLATVVLPSLMLLWLLIGFYGAGQIWRPSTNVGGDILKRYRDVETQWQRALGDWRTKCSSAGFVDLKTTLAKVKAEIERLPAVEQQQTKAYNDSRRSQQLKNFLDGFQIRRVKISGIGPSKLATLTSYGVETAADVTESAVLRVPGFGPVSARALVLWRDQVAAKFVYNASPTASDTAAINAIKADLAKRSASLHEQLVVGAKRLAQMSADVRNRQQKPTAELLRLHAERSQLLGDLGSLGITPPSVYVAPLSPSSQPSRYSSSVGGATVCPRCSSGMRLRTARRGANAGNKFWGCSRYPRCTATRPYP